MSSDLCRRSRQLVLSVVHRTGIETIRQHPVDKSSTHRWYKSLKSSVYMTTGRPGCRQLTNSDEDRASQPASQDQPSTLRRVSDSIRNLAELRKSASWMTTWIGRIGHNTFGHDSGTTGISPQSFVFAVIINSNALQAQLENFPHSFVADYRSIYGPNSKFP